MSDRDANFRSPAAIGATPPLEALLGRLEAGQPGPAAAVPGGPTLSNPAAIFDALTGADSASLRRAGHFFEVIAYPGEQVERQIEGDHLLIRRVLGEGQLASLRRAEAIPAGTTLGLDSLIVRARPAARDALAEATFDVDKAVTQNRDYMSSLHWQPHFDRIVTLLGFTNLSPDEATFARAVADWQGRNGLTADGIIGPNTWAKLSTALGLAGPPAPAPAVTASQVCFPSGLCLSVVSGGPTGPNQEHWDPTGSGNPLLDTGPAYRQSKLSPHFTVGELTSSGGRQFAPARIDPKLVECLEKLRTAVGKPIHITSGYRSWGHNVAIYRKRGKKPTKSQHCAGRAVDIRIAGMSGLDIAKAAIDACGCRIAVGVGSNYAHIDVRGQWQRWGYGPNKQSYRREISAYHDQRCP